MAVIIVLLLYESGDVGNHNLAKRKNGKVEVRTQEENSKEGLK